MEYNKKMFFKNNAQNEAERLVPDLFLFFKKSFIIGKSKWSTAFEVKTFLTEHLQNQIQFCPSERANKSIFVV